MRKLLMALTLVGVTYLSAEAQETKCVCKTVTKHSTNKHVAYAKKGKSNYAQNFKICKDNYGYHVCGEVSTCMNSTYCIPGVNEGPIVAQKDYNGGYNSYTYNNNAYNYTFTDDQQEDAVSQPTAAMIAPQSQSYPTAAQVNALYAGQVVTHKGKIAVAYDNATAPYEGLPSPQDDGPKRNKQRNLNENSVAQNTTNPALQLPPASGSGVPRRMK